MVYFVQCGQGGPVKIGFTEEPVGYRLASMQTGSPEELRVLTVIPSGNRTLERALHEHFRADHVRGEWFNPTPEMLAFIEKQEAENAQPLETAWQLRGDGRQICNHCESEYVLPPRRLYCSKKCAESAHRERQCASA